jgi:hypothetical protein
MKTPISQEIEETIETEFLNFLKTDRQTHTHTHTHSPCCKRLPRDIQGKKKWILGLHSKQSGRKKCSAWTVGFRQFSVSYDLGL